MLINAQIPSTFVISGKDGRLDFRMRCSSSQHHTVELFKHFQHANSTLKNKVAFDKLTSFVI